MRIRKQALERMIREEIEGVLSEANPYHLGSTGNKTGGRFTSKDKAKSYSLSNKAKDNQTKSPEHKAPLRGKMTGGGKVNALAGMNTSSSKACGRQTMPDGAPKNPTHSCSEYPKRYNEAFQVLEEIAEALGTLKESQVDCSACLNNFVRRLKQSNLAIKQALDPKVNEHDTYAGEKVSPGDRKTPTRRSTDRRRKFRNRAGMDFDKTGFSADERKLLNPDSLY